MRILLISLILFLSQGIQAQQCDKVIMTNPLNLNYRFQTDGACRREAADPVIVLFKERYYLFASHSAGYWHSSNLKDWTYIETQNLKSVKAWAPAVLVYKGAVYNMGMSERQIYKSRHPELDQWEKIETDLPGFGDPAFFQDKDGKVYLYYGCSASEPVKGFEVDPENGFKAVGPEVDLIPYYADRLGWDTSGTSGRGC